MSYLQNIFEILLNILSFGLFILAANFRQDRRRYLWISALILAAFLHLAVQYQGISEWLHVVSLIIGIALSALIADVLVEYLRSRKSRTIRKK